MNNKKKNEGQTDFSYYGLYLLDYLRTNKFEQADDTAFIRERADRAAETYERARLEGGNSETGHIKIEKRNRWRILMVEGSKYKPLWGH